MVLAPSATDFNIADAVTSFDVSQLAGTGDVSVLASGANALLSLSSFARSDGAAPSPEELAQLESAIAAKTGSLISSLANSAADYISDPETMQQVRLQAPMGVQVRTHIYTHMHVAQQCSESNIALLLNPAQMNPAPAPGHPAYLKASPPHYPTPIHFVWCLHAPQVVSAVATLSKASDKISDETRAKMLDVADAGITAADLTANGLSPAEASRLWSVIAAGNSLTDNCNVEGAACAATAESARRRLLHLTRQLLEAAAAASPSPSPAPATSTVNTSSSNTTTTTTTTNATAGSLASAPADSVSQAAGAALLAGAAAVADLLAVGASPSGGALAGGDNGLFVSVAALLGSGYGTSALAAGPVLAIGGRAADASAGENARVRFSKALQGACVDEEGVALRTGGLCTNVAVPVRLTYLADASMLMADTDSADTAVAPPASRRRLASHPGSTDFQVVSGAVMLQVDDASNTSTAFPCSGGCSASVTIPIWERAASGMLYDCARLEDGLPVVEDDAAQGVVVGSDGVPAVTCVVNRAGTYLVGKSADPNRPQGTTEDEDATYEGMVVSSQCEITLASRCNQAA